MNTYFIYFFFISLLIISSFSSPQIEVFKLKEDVYIYQSFGTYQGNLVSANGLIVESSNEVALIDSPWDEQQTIQLLDWIDREIGKPISFTIITHAHKDRIGGIEILKSRNIPTISNRLTQVEASKKGFRKPDQFFNTDTLLTFGNSSLEAYYPGPGHTIDNSVVYLNNHDILYGGCFIKSSTSNSLGNLEDAVLVDWPNSLQHVIERYPEHKVVIPGHGNWNPGAMENTLNLLSKMN